MIDELLNVFRPIAEEKGVSLKSEINEGDEVMADRESFLVTMRNLIGNALKFTNEGAVTIFSSRENDQLVIGVRDTGIGIPEELLNRLFVIEEEKIRRGTRNEKGTGLGLNLAYEFTKINGGKMEVESQEGTGTTFLVYLVHA